MDGKLLGETDNYRQPENICFIKQEIISFCS